jgi:hypothetical protein
LLLADTIFAQTNLSNSPDSITVSKKEITIEKDITDLIRSANKKDKHKIITATDTTDNQRLFSFIPAAGYSLQTGLAGILSANLAYFNGTAIKQKISSISTSVTFTQYNQTIVPLVVNIWTKNNRYNFISDNRYIDYPSNIYGISGRTNPNKGHQIAFYALKFHQTILKSVANNLYAGVGYYYDQFWSIKVLDSVTKRMNALINRQLGTGETASSIALKLMYDNRLNQINSKNGWYVNLVYRDSYKFLGSDNNWQ